ncbi:J domain-containing protein [Actinocrinis puniceicyclus]|uniref:J domain-containing protein n=1 Tax=Actinocrinis puniceicyclus TaxID=977794 RepID=A0A8J8BC88_9ACTN|nr:J domain-containing protein [Actinocrinis puniceicyclus]MBS2963280.1 J domain-containing protein [Actinocrinis puniceicyclus]
MDVSATSATAVNPFGTASPPTGGQAAPSLEDTVASAERGLAEAQIALETTRFDLDRLTRLHHHHLGPLYDRLDELDLMIAEARAAMTGDPEQARRAYELRYGPSGQPVFDPLTDPLPTEPEPTAVIDPEYASTLRFTEPVEEPSKSADPAKTLQRLYRDLARRAHPDFTQDPREKERRNAFITRVNDAYRRSNLYELQRLAEEWVVISAEGPQMGTEERQLWLRQRLIWLRARTAEARVERETLLSSPLGQVLAEFGAERALEALYARLYEQIQHKERELHAVYTTDVRADPGAYVTAAYAADAGYAAQHAYAADPVYATEPSGPLQAGPLQASPVQYATPYPAQVQQEKPGLGFFG